jgi:hypothetical protein
VIETITADEYTYETAPGNPNRIVTIWRARRREFVNAKGQREEAYFWDRWTIADPLNPSLTIWTNDRRKDVTDEYVNPAEWKGAAYDRRDGKPWVKDGQVVHPQGRPILPFALYKLDGGPAVQSYYMMSEVVFGTLQVALLWTAGVHGMLRASWDQRVLLNGRIKSGTTETVTGTGTAIRTLTADPTSIPIIDGDNAAIGAWGASIDIEKAEKFCRYYEARLAMHFGLSPADLVIDALNPQSGASITVSQRGKRVLQIKQRPFFRRGDLQLTEVLCSVARTKGRTLKADGVKWRYVGVALTPEERQLVGSYCKAELDMGLMTLEDAWLELHPGADREQAAAAVRAVELEKKRRAMQSQLEQPEPPEDDDDPSGEEDEEDAEAEDEDVEVDEAA